MLGGAAATPSFAATSGAGKVPAAARPARTTTTMKTVVYQGYEFKVPASWPVYRLDEHPQTCVRYDVHAVYLGQPGPDMRCPAGLVGRTQTVSFIPGKAGAVTGQPGRPGRAAGAELRRFPAVHGVLRHSAAEHELSVALGGAAPGATLMGTYGTDPGVIEHVLSTVHLAPANATQTAQTGPAPARPGNAGPATSHRAQPASRLVAAAPLGSPGLASPAPASPAPASWPGLPAHWPAQIARPPQLPRPPQPPPPVGGFDTCTAPALATMRVWRSDYAAVGVYIGGANSACAYGNFSASWVRAVTSAGWGLIPTYVGPQAPCWGGNGATINPGSAAAQGRAAATDAVNDERAFGLQPGSPIYYDMEGYSGSAACTAAVLQFLGAWDSQVAAAGYVSGVYSSQNSGIADMQAAIAARTPGFTPPDAIWFALWDNDPTLSDGGLSWPLADRSKQYAGNVSATIQGITLNVDKDIVGGPLAH
jgi:hypothetical protein